MSLALHDVESGVGQDARRSARQESEQCAAGATHIRLSTASLMSPLVAR